jgi:dephospho-CoA kinase
MLKVIGLTGGSGAGKGEVSKALARLGAHIIYTDEIAHEVILSGEPAYDELLAGFGKEILFGSGGEIDRKKLGAAAFCSEEKRRRLMDITHKYIVERAVGIIAAKQKEPGGSGAIVIDAPLLIEANMHGFCDQVWVVSADAETRIKRVVKRGGVTEETARRRAAAQMTADEMAAYADVVIENGGGLEELVETAEKLYRSVI